METDKFEAFRIDRGWEYYDYPAWVGDLLWVNPFTDRVNWTALRADGTAISGKWGEYLVRIKRTGEIQGPLVKQDVVDMELTVQ